MEKSGTAYEYEFSDPNAACLECGMMWAQSIKEILYYAAIVAGKPVELDDIVVSPPADYNPGSVAEDLTAFYEGVRFGAPIEIVYPFGRAALSRRFPNDTEVLDNFDKLYGPKSKQQKTIPQEAQKPSGKISIPLMSDSGDSGTI